MRSAERDRSSNVARWLDTSLERFGDYDAAIIEGRTFASRALADETNRLAGALSQHGISDDDRVLVAVANCRELLVVSPAIWRCGGTVVLAYAGSPLAELARIVEHAKPAAIVTSPELV